MTKTILFAAGSALALSLPSIPASAQNAPSQAVAYADLDLRTQAGVDRLDRRIKTAVVKVCGGPPPADTSDIAKTRRCRKDTAAMTLPLRDEVIRIARSEGGSVKVARLEVTATIRRD